MIPISDINPAKRTPYITSLVQSSVENFITEDIADKKFKDFAGFVSSII